MSENPAAFRRRLRRALVWYSGYAGHAPVSTDWLDVKIYHARLEGVHVPRSLRAHVSRDPFLR